MESYHGGVDEICVYSIGRHRNVVEGNNITDIESDHEINFDKVEQ